MSKLSALISSFFSSSKSKTSLVPKDVLSLTCVDTKTNSLNASFGISEERSMELGKWVSDELTKLAKNPDLTSGHEWMPNLFIKLYEKCRTMEEVCVFFAILSTNLDILKYASSPTAFSEHTATVKKLRKKMKEAQGIEDDDEDDVEQPLEALEKVLKELLNKKDDNK